MTPNSMFRRSALGAVLTVALRNLGLADYQILAMARAHGNDPFQTMRALRRMTLPLDLDKVIADAEATLSRLPDDTRLLTVFDSTYNLGGRAMLVARGDVSLLTRQTLGVDGSARLFDTEGDPATGALPTTVRTDARNGAGALLSALPSLSRYSLMTGTHNAGAVVAREMALRQGMPQIRMVSMPYARLQGLAGRDSGISYTLRQAAYRCKGAYPGLDTLFEGDPLSSRMSLEGLSAEGDESLRRLLGQWDASIAKYRRLLDSGRGLKAAKPPVMKLETDDGEDEWVNPAVCDYDGWDLLCEHILLDSGNSLFLSDCLPGDEGGTTDWTEYVGRACTHAAVIGSTRDGAFERATAERSVPLMQVSTTRSEDRSRIRAMASPERSDNNTYALSLAEVPTEDGGVRVTVDRERVGQWSSQGRLPGSRRAPSPFDDPCL